MVIDWFSFNHLHLHQGLKSIVTSDPAPFPLHVNQISTLPLPHIFIKTVSQVSIPPRTIAIIPTAFNGTPKPNCHYSMIESLFQHEPQPHLLVVPILKIFGKKLPFQLLCTIINTSPDEINNDDPFEPLMLNEVMYTIDADQVDTQCMQTKNISHHQC